MHAAGSLQHERPPRSLAVSSAAISMVSASVPAIGSVRGSAPSSRACHFFGQLAIFGLYYGPGAEGRWGSSMVLALALAVTAFGRLPEETHRPLSLGGQAEVFVQDADTAGVIRSPLTMSNLEAPHAELPPKAPMAPTPDAYGRVDCWGPLVDRQRQLFMGWSYRSGYQMAMSLFVDHLNDTQKSAQLDARLHIHQSLRTDAQLSQQPPGTASEQVSSGEVETTLDKFRTEVLAKSGHCATRADWMNPNIFKFKVVRSPFARAVSIYHYELSTNCGQKHRLQVQMARALGLGGAEQFPSVSFVQYLRALTNTGLDVFDAQATPQIKQFEQSHGGYDYICKVEEITRCLADLNERANTTFGNLTLEMPNTAAEPAFDVAGAPFSQIRDAMPPVQHFYSGASGLEAQQIVQALYKADFDAYNYSYTIPKNGLSLFLHFEHANGQRYLETHPWMVRKS